MILITIEVGANDFAKAYEILKSTLAMHVDSIARMDGSSNVEVEEFNDESGGKIGNLLFSKESKKVIAQQAEPKSETCKWKKHKSAYRIICNPHNDCVCDQDRKDCPTCGKKVEVVE